MTILLDPWSLAWQNPIACELEAEDYVERLTSLFDLSSQACVSIVISDEAAELLAADGVYPLGVDMPDVLWPNRADVYRLVASLLEKIPKISRTGIVAVLVDNVSRMPEINFHVSGRHLSHLDELSAVSLIVPERSATPAPQILSSYAAPSSKHQYRLSVEDADCVDRPEVRTGPYMGDVTFFGDLPRCVQQWVATDLLMRGFVLEAIALSVWQRSGAGGSNPFATEGWVLGADFTRSLGSCGVVQNRARVDALLRACANVVLRENQRAIHALRISSSGASAQRVRADGSAAWRADVDDEYHLHYWSSGLGIEFANAVVHNDFDISQ